MPETPGQPIIPPPFHKRHKRALIITLASIVIVIVAGALLFGNEKAALLATINKYMEWLIELVDEKIGPVPFFIAYAILPAVGVSLWFFNVTAGMVFVERIGLGWVLVLAAISIAIANALSYWLARSALRPLVEKIIKRLGYKMPDIPRNEHVSATIVMRVVPGIPYIVQSYVLALANVRFAPYMIVSFIVRYGWAVANILLGRASRSLAECEASTSSAANMAIPVALIILLAIGTHWMRKYYAKKSKAAPRPPDAPRA